MKKLLSIIIAACMCVFGVMCCVGCGEKPYVDTSNAAVPGQFDDPEAAKAKEKEDDAAGREHIQIPEGAETIEIDGEEYIPIDSLYIDPKIYGEDCLSKNYILTGDVDITGDTKSIGYIKNYRNYKDGIAFTGKFNGNNYKIYGERRRRIFDYINGAEVSNFVLSSQLIATDDSTNSEVLFCAQAIDSRFNNIVNYSCLNDSEGIIYYSIKCELNNIVNYGDGVNMSGTLIRGMQSCIAKNCNNYGNLSQKREGIKCFGAIIGIVWHFGENDSVIENCNNYGNLIGDEYVGGILGRVIYFTDTIGAEQLNKPSTLINCNNYGDIYRNKESKEFYCIGGIVGSGPKLENCANQGHIYGFESVNPQYTAQYIGGIAGNAIAVENCISNYKVELDLAVKYADNICGYYLTKFY